MEIDVGGDRCRDKLVLVIVVIVVIVGSKKESIIHASN